MCVSACLFPARVVVVVLVIGFVIVVFVFLVFGGGACSALLSIWTLRSCERRRVLAA